MTRERLSTWLHWAAIVVGAGLLLAVLGARGPAGPARSGVSMLAPGGQSSALAQTVADMAGPHISGPYTSTTKAFSFDGNVSQLPHVKESAPPDGPEVDSGLSEAISPPSVKDPVVQSSNGSGPGGPNMPNPIMNFAGLDATIGGAYHPPDTNGDVGPIYYVQNVNDEIGIYTKTTGLLAATPFSFNELFASAGTGTLCDTNNAGDPVVLYDAQVDRFIVTDFAFTSTTSGPSYECIGASQTSDPTGAWWLYALLADPSQLADYPKLGVWPDAIYMSANMYNGGEFNGTRVWALNRTNLYSGVALQAVHFDVSPSTLGTALPSNLRGPAPPAGTPNYFVSNISNGSSFWALAVFKFHVDFVHTASSSFTGPTQVNVDSFTNPPDPHAVSPTYIPEVSGNGLDSLGIRLMVQNQYRRIGNTESLWVTHTADDAPTGVRWYQLDVTGGNIATTPVQQSTYKPDSKYRWMPSLAVDKSGNMAIGYSVSSASTHPDILYAGRLVTDPLGTLGQAEVTLAPGGGGQTGDCAPLSPCYRWGDYSAMTVDPTDDCTFWYTNEYYAVDGSDWLTQIGSFKFPSCGAVVTNFNTYLPLVVRSVSGIQGQVTFNGAPAAGVFLELIRVDGGSFSTQASGNTDANGFYDFQAPSLPAGQHYFVRYRNQQSDSSRLWYWATANINNYTAGDAASAGNFDLANVALVSPAPGATVGLPAQFQWTPRSATTSDSYQFTLFDPNSNAFQQTALLGYVNGVTVTSVASDFHSETPYGWYVAINSPDGGYGQSYYSRGVTFSNILAGSQPAVAGGATVRPASPPVDRPGR